MSCVFVPRYKHVADRVGYPGLDTQGAIVRYLDEKSLGMDKALICEQLIQPNQGMVIKSIIL